ncbi:MAG: sugar phosphate nucleotidyltransferase [Planctomycetota bacterium]|nr:sugar phosphate nucleotidyltransferase [Planctomycetota bacterium]
MVSKAIIPVAGLGTRLGPITRAVPKAMLPLLDSRDRLRPVVHFICAEAAAAGIDQVALVVSLLHQQVLRSYFDAAREAGDANLPGQIEFIVQAKPNGLGDAVACGAQFVGRREEGFCMLLGDHIYTAQPDRPTCAGQVVAAFDDRRPAAMIGMQTVGPEELARVGTAGGKPVGDNIYRCTSLVEKPSIATARAKLRTPGLGEDKFLAHCGIYIFTPEIFDCLAELSARVSPAGQELPMTEAQQILLRRHPEDYYLLRIAGAAYDTGNTAGYAAAQAAIRPNQPA